jgi:putative DNA primase/helicase
LKGEAPGILNWAVAGCLKWQKGGLKAPQSVLAASEEYREQNDPLKEFLEDCCEIGPSQVVAVSRLRETYIQWADENGYQPLSHKSFNGRMATRGFKQERFGHARTRLWAGLSLRTTSEPEVRTEEDNESLLLVN